MRDTANHQSLLTVGFLGVMVFAIGPSVLPAFCGARVLFSKTLMFSSLLLLNLGCALRVASEIPAYEGFWHPAWSVLPVSAVTELVAVTLFAINLMLTFMRPPAHLIRKEKMEWTPGVRHKVKGLSPFAAKSIGGEVAVDPLWKYLSGG